MNFGQSYDLNLHSDLEAVAHNILKKRAEDNIDTAFGKIHNGQAATSKDEFEYNPSKYERIAFKSKRDRDTFVAYMANNGYKVGKDVAFLKNAVNGQYLVEIPKEMEISDLDPSGRLTEYNGDTNGGNAFSAQAVLKEFEEETHIEYQEATKFEEEDPNKVRVDVTGNGAKDIVAKARAEIFGGTGFFTLYNAAKDLKEVSDVVRKKDKNTKDLQNKYGMTSDETFLKTGKQTGTKMKTAFVVKDESSYDGYRVLVDGMEVKAGAARDNIIARHQKRVEDAHKTAIKAEKKRGKADTKTAKSKDKADEWNDKLHKSKNPSKNTLHETYAMDFRNKKAEAELEALLLARGVDLSDFKSKKDSAGNEIRRVYTDASGEKIVVNHYHRNTKKKEAKLTVKEQTAEKVERAIYGFGGGTQQYAMTHGFETQQLTKKVTLSKEQQKDFAEILKNNPDVFNAFKNRNQNAEAILSALATTGVADLTIADRSLLERAVQKGISKDPTWEKEIRLSMRPDTKLSKAFSVSQIERYDAAQSAFKVDEGLQGLKEIATNLSLSKVVSKAQRGINFDAAEIYAMAQLSQSTGAGFSVHEKAVLEKYIKGFSAAQNAGEHYNPVFSVQERGDLEAALKKYRDNRKTGEINGVKISDLLKKVELKGSEREAVTAINGLERELGVDLSGGFTTEKMLEINEAFIKKAEAQGMFFVNHGKFNTKLLNQLGSNELKALGISADTRSLIAEINTKGKITKGTAPVKDAKSASIGGLMSRKGSQRIKSALSKDEDTAAATQEIDEFTSKAGAIKRGAEYTNKYISKGATSIRNSAEKLKAKRAARNAGKSGYDKNGVKLKKPKKLTPKQEAARQSKLNKKFAKGSEDKNAKFIAKTGKKANKAAKKGAAYTKGAAKAGKTATKAAKTAKSAGGLAAGAATANPVKVAAEAIKLAAQHWKLFAIKMFAPVAGIATILLSTAVIFVGIIMCISAFLDAINPFNWASKLAAPKTYQDTAAYRIYDDHLKPKEKVWLRDNVYDFDKFFDERSASKYGADYVYFPDYIASFDNLVAFDHDGNGFYSDIYINPFWQTNTTSSHLTKQEYTYSDKSKGYSYEPDASAFNTEILTYSAAIEGEYSGSKNVTIGANNNAFQKLKYAPDGKVEYGYLSVESGHTSNLKDILCMTDVMYGMDLSDSHTTDFGEHDAAPSDFDSITGDYGMAGMLGKSPAQIEIENAEDNVKGFFKWLIAVVKWVFNDKDFPRLKDFCSGKLSYGTVVNYCEHLFEGSHQEEMALSVEYHKVQDLLQFSTESGDVLEFGKDSIGQSQASLLGVCLNPKVTRFYLMWNTGDGHGDRVSPFFYQYNNKSGTKYPVDVAGTYDVQITMANRTNALTWQGGAINHDWAREMNESGVRTNTVIPTGGLIDHEDCIKADMGGNEATYDWIKDYIDNYGTVMNSNDYDPAGNKGCWQTTKDEEVIAEKYVGGVSGGNYTKSGVQGDSYYTWNSNDTPSSHSADDGWFDSEADARAAAEEYLRQEYNMVTIPTTIYSLNGERTLFDYKHAEVEPFEMTDVEIETREVCDGDWDYNPYYWSSGGFGGSLTHDGSGHWSAWYAIVMNGYGEGDTSGNTHACGGGGGTWDMRDIGIFPNGSRSYGNGAMASVITKEKSIGHIKDIIYVDWGTTHYDDWKEWKIITDDDGNETDWKLILHKASGEPAEVTFSSRSQWDDAHVVFAPICSRKPTYKTQYRVKYAKAKAYTQYWTQFTRDCQGHNFRYCGGHIACHSHGVVFSITNEQVDMTEVKDYTNGAPKVETFPFGDRGYDEIRGKVITEEVDYNDNPFPEAAKTGGCRSPLFDVQGSVTGMIGLNAYVDDNEWLDGYDTRSSDSYHLMKDIFDIDCNILKGDNIFPTIGCDLGQYEGWNADNMQLAILKYCSDWHEEYGFDIPQEICYSPYAIDRTTHEDVDLFKILDTNEDTIKQIEGGYECGQDTLSQDDIDRICEELKSAYGSSFTEEREEAVRFTLGYVGQGHYNPNHNHNFLASECQSLTIEIRDVNGESGMVGGSYLNYSGNCTAGKEDSFTSFVRSHFGRSCLNESNTHYYSPTKYSYNAATGTCNALPADTIIHYASSNYTDVTLPDDFGMLMSGWLGNVQWDKNTKAGFRNWQHLFRTILLEKDFHTAVFIGVVKNEIVLSTGQIIEPNTPIVVDLTAMSSQGIEGLGNVYLHGMPKTEYLENKSFCDYWWLTNETSKTYFVSF